jgi:CMP-N,N'-diacetyllegionaminic acid synthase
LKPLVVIPARAGSKGVPRKNIKLLNGKPLIQYTIEAARGVFADEYICVSTDDEEIKSITESLGLAVPFLRPKHLATDTAGTSEVLLHAVEFYENKGYYPDTLVLLQATSPFRTAQHLKEALSIYSTSCEMVVSVKETKANPYYILFEENAEGWLEKSKLGDFTCRQDCPPVWEYNGAIYIIDIQTFKKKGLMGFNRIRKYVMDEFTSHDIDTPIDWLLAKVIIKSMFKKLIQ